MNAYSADLLVAIPGDALVLLVGASGSGKSSLAARLFPAESILSSDALRGQLSGDEANQAASARAFQILHAQAERRLASGRLTVVDATNLYRSARQPLARRASAHRRPIVVLVLDLPAQTCLDRNAARPGRVVPERVIVRQLAAVRRAIDRGDLHREAHDRLIILGDAATLDALAIRLTASGPTATLSPAQGSPAASSPQPAD